LTANLRKNSIAFSFSAKKNNIPQHAEKNIYPLVHPKETSYICAGKKFLYKSRRRPMRAAAAAETE
jgi:hypothetical protein